MCIFAERFLNNMEYRKYIYGLFSFLAIAIVLVSCNNRQKATDSSGTITNNQMHDMGAWQVGSYVDGYGDATGQQYIYLQGDGQFENSMGSKTPITATIYVDGEGNISLEIKEYGKYKIKTGDYTLSIRKQDGSEIELKHYYGLNGFDFKYTQEFKKLAASNTLCSFIMFPFAGHPKYVFKLNFTGYDNALSELNKDYVGVVGE